MSVAAQYDVIILGAGPAGFTAGIYLGRFMFKTLLLDFIPAPHEADDIEGVRSTVHGKYMNVPGFPEGIERQELKWKGIHQAQNAGCDYRIDRVTAITRHPKHFTVQCDAGEYTTTAIVFALGAQDIWLELPGLDRFIGKSAFWSVESNGKEAMRRPAVIIGHDDHAAMEAVRLKTAFTDEVSLLTHAQPTQWSDEMRGILSHLGIPVVEKRIKILAGNDGMLERLTFEDNEVLPVEMLYYPTEKQPRSQLAVDLGIHVDGAGFIQVNERFETSMTSVYAVGDITSRGPEQVVAAYYHGMQAALSIYDDHFRRELHHLHLAAHAHSV